MKTIGTTVSAFFKTRLALQVENAALRHQLIILRRASPKRLSLTRLDRMIFASLHRLWPKVLGSIAIVQPKTVIGWHRLGFRLYWRWKCGGKGGRPKVPQELRELIREMSLANPLWGAPRIHGELLKIGVEVCESTVAAYMVRPLGPPGQTWSTFLRNHIDQMASTDFFVVPTLTFQVLYAMVVLNHARRRILHVAVTANPKAEWKAQQLRDAFPWNTAPRFLVHDGHGSFKGECAARAKIKGIKMQRIAPASPWQNAFAERVIGSIRRECTDHIVALNARHLTAILRTYTAYYNRSRTHLSLAKDTPIPQPANTNTSGRIVAIPEVGGLHRRYDRLAA